MRFFQRTCWALLLALLPTCFAIAADWSCFRGPNGSGVATGQKALPTTWSETENLKWKAKLPGKGSSCPIIVGDRVFVTCWTGYGVDARDPGDIANLKRVLLCIDRKTGKTLWSKEEPAVLPEEPYERMFAQHGYASHTPVSDGKHVFVFYGKTGVLAYDMQGNKLWQTSVGTEDDPRHWGSASSPILYKNLVIVTAATESQAVVGLDKKTGREVWRQEAGGFSGTWGTPILVDVADGKQELVLAVPYEIWGINPENGKLRWYCNGAESDSMCASAIAHEGVVYVVGGRGSAVAVRAGGKGDVTKTHTLWSTSVSARITSPVFHQGRIYFISGGVANCLEASSGERVYQGRLTAGATPPPTTPPAAARSEQRRPSRGFGRRSGGGGFGRSDYSSPVIADGKMFFVSRSGTTSVLALGTQFKQLGSNRFASDNGDFSATPAVGDGELLIRSSATLYSVAQEK
ncbi:MAG: serine/threonine protein kinase [Planctomycetaceae bacterium]|nr:serine/threonine protein kinase [Planctomycetaceae bacterium]